MSRTICIGDIHGCLAEFDQLCQTVGYVAGRDRLILLGDLIDRGPDSAGVVRRAREIGAEALMGNHEEKALRWRRHEAARRADPARYRNPMLPIHVDRLAEWARISDDDWAWLAARPTFLHVDATWTAVHGGCMPGVAVEAQRPNDLLRMRYIDPTKGKMVSPDARGEMPPGAVHWRTVWTGPRSIVYGHYTYAAVQITEAADSSPLGPPPALTIGIDTGCVHGGLLTAFVRERARVDTVYIVEVQAAQVYAERKAWNEE